MCSGQPTWCPTDAIMAQAHLVGLDLTGIITGIVVDYHSEP
jgi:hypothetical protein